MPRKIRRDQNIHFYDRKLTDNPSPHFLVKLDIKKEDLDIEEKSIIKYRKIKQDKE